MAEKSGKFETEQAKQNDDVNSRATNDENERDDLEEGEIAVNDDVSKAVMHHPLQHSWTFWFRSSSAKSSTEADWERSLRPIHTFSHVEVFWSLYNNIRHPSQLTTGADLHCFKNHIEPKWEDPLCANGGKLTATFQKGKSDNAWMNSLLAMIGEQFDHGNEICGAVVNVRRQERISLWIKNAENKAAQLSIGEQWKGFIAYNEQIVFQSHDESRRSDRNAKNKYTA
ncbi:mRNA cap-binding protein [Heracleum sosnowskyi]|uniref:eIF-4F 25 kDa subunit n=1 Tax=Heracleum sosnowskyi TaxID=360622 RepID=A0AAD8N151_9APIA|nr:mRNA cap-binding protein [Heracleum sosnowskyi]